MSIHTCSYYCDRPECIRAQRDELRQKLEQAEQPIVDCFTCENRRQLMPFAQETYCENCIYGSPWKKNYYKEKKRYGT